MTTANLEITKIQIQYGLDLDATNEVIKAALINAEFAKTQNNWVGYSHFLQVAAGAAEKMAAIQAASDAFETKWMA
jgi:hypothetical protein